MIEKEVHKDKNKIKEEMKKKLIEKKIKIRSQEKYTFKCSDSRWYPTKELCNSYQKIWLDEKDSIKIEYINTEKFDKKDTEYREKIKFNKESRLIVQEFNDENLTKIKIKTNIKNILFALDIILIMYYEGSMSYENNDIIVIKNKKILPIRSFLKEDNDEDEIDYFECVIEDKKEFIEIMTENINEEVEIDIIIRDYDSYWPMFSLHIFYEHYDYDEYYFYDKEVKRIEEIEKEANEK